ncbi:acyl-CoA dehydrogenase [Thalassospiraceae bacterium LMO-SO8]|nr:acyl-CoA dehydrogenase [Alphaproteobacteria bacterium LMO-S08]WND75253.1 acyl-CoA dehydrogenase [Thalassospiraceae bacterium LMO-SO8]
MNFELTEEQRLFQDAVGAFARDHLAEGALERAHAGEYPRDVAKLMAENGLLGITIAEEDGGQGGSLMDAVIAIQEVAMHCPRSADVIQAGSFGAIRVLAAYGTPDQKERYLKPLLAGETLIAVGMTEPDAGSAVTDLRTTATPDGEGLRINGQKCFTSHSPEADVFLVYVRFGPGVGGIGSVLIPRDAPGLEFGKPTPFLGGDDWAPLFFTDLYVPPENILLREGGFKKQIAGFNVERIGNTARSLALGRLAFETAREHALTRKQFDRPLAEFQGLQWKFAEMQIKLDAGQLLLYRAAVNADNGFPSAQETAIAKAFCNEAGHWVSSEALQVMGGMGYSQDSIVEYCFRRTRGWMIAGGSIEILKNRIAEGVFDTRFSQRPPRAK